MIERNFPVQVNVYENPRTWISHKVWDTETLDKIQELLLGQYYTLSYEFQKEEVSNNTDDGKVC